MASDLTNAGLRDGLQEGDHAGVDGGPALLLLFPNVELDSRPHRIAG